MFPEYVVDDDDTHASATEPIKVTKVKKKANTKKKRTAIAGTG